MMQKLIAGARELGLEIASEQLNQFQLYYDELIDWNTRANLTAITDYDEAQTKLFLDSLSLLTALPALASKSDLSLVDVGSGAGFPGLPLKIVFPQIKLVLVESTTKKAKFLHHIIDLLKLDAVTVVNARAETLAHQDDYREQFDAATCRAVGSLAATAELTLPFCGIGGLFIAQKKGNIDDELQKANTAIAKLGGELSRIERVRLGSLNDERLLVIITKVRSTPPAYPRRPGMPAKRPL